MVCAVSVNVRAMWSVGVAYCDLKTTNILYRRKGDVFYAVLGDLGSIVPRRSHDGSYKAGIFTFPPQRAMDGIVVPIEADLVWGLGALLLTLMHGTAWVSDRLTGDALRMRCDDDISTAFSAASAEIRAVADEMRAMHGGSGVRIADALEIAIAAWNGAKEGTLRKFCAAIRG